MLSGVAQTSQRSFDAENVKVSDQMIHVISAVRVRATVGAKQIYRPRERKIEKECDKSTGTMRYTSDETSIVAGQK